MADPIPSPSEKTVVVFSCQLRRLWTLTIISLVLSGVIILLLIVGAIVRHHQMHRMAEQARFGMMYSQMRGGFGPGRFGGRDGGPGMRGFGGPGNFGGPGGGDRRGMMGMGGGRGEPPDPAKMSDKIMDRLSQKLSLTDDEKTKIKPIVEQQVTDFQKQMEAQRAAMKKQIEDTKAKIRPLLTPDQQKQLDAIPLPGDQPNK